MNMRCTSPFLPGSVRGLTSVCAGLFVVTATAGAVAQPSESAANGIADENDRELAVIAVALEELETRYGLATAPSVTKVERRLRQGEVHFLLKDYLRASVALLDVVDDPAQRSHPRYDDCVFLLAESLRASRNFSGARRYYEDILGRAEGERLKDVVLGLLEIAGATGQFNNVDRYIQRLREAKTLSRPDVDYIYGKMLFRVGDEASVNRAYSVFSGVASGNSVSGRAAYYAAVSLVRLGQYQTAIERFGIALERIPAGDAGQQLRDLTNLSLGRLYQELGQVTESADVYQEISQDSVYFPDMLYEVAWVQVTAANQAETEEDRRVSYRRALQATELLMATSPDSRLYPQARILQGNLLIRLGASENAYETFQTIVDEYGNASLELSGLKRNKDPRVFFDQLLAADLEQINNDSILPPLAVSWALEEDQVSRAVAMQRDLADSEDFLREARDLVDTLQRALAGEQRYNMFPGLRKARSQTIGTENRMLNIQRRLLDLERAIVFPTLTEPEQGKIDLVHAQALDIEKEVSVLPLSTEQVEAKRQQLKDEFLDAGRQAHRLSYQISGMQAQLVAVDRWYRDNIGKLDERERTLMRERLQKARAAVKQVDREQVLLEREIGNAAYLVDGDAGRTRAMRLKAQFDEVLAEERNMLKEHRTRVPSRLQGVLSRIDGQRIQLRRFAETLQSLQDGLDRRVEKRADEILQAIVAEARKLDTYERERLQLAGATNSMLGPVAQRTLDSVQQQFNNLVLKADVGIIDVAWARKQAQTEKVNTIIQQQQQAVRELELEFTDALRE